MTTIERSEVAEKITRAIFEPDGKCHLNWADTKKVIELHLAGLPDGDEMIFKRMRSIAFEAPSRSSRFKKWLRAGRTGMEFHHVFGSSTKLKSTDHFAVMVTPDAHRKGQDDRSWTIEQCAHGFRNLLNYVRHLEST